MKSGSPYQNSLGQEHNVGSMFVRITKWYDLLNHLLSLGTDLYWRSQLIKTIARSHPENIQLLDLAAGTLDVCKATQKKMSQASILALDLAFPMIYQGLAKISHLRFLGLCADAKKIPIRDESIDCVTMAFGIRNIVPRHIAYKEILRILVPGGSLYILEFGSGQQKIGWGLYNYYLDHILPKIGGLISGDPKAYSYLSDSIKSFPKADELQSEILFSGFHRVTFKSLSFGIAYLHMATKAPSMVH